MHLSYDGQMSRVSMLENTKTVNAFGKYVLDLKSPKMPMKGRASAEKKQKSEGSFPGCILQVKKRSLPALSKVRSEKHDISAMEMQIAARVV